MTETVVFCEEIPQKKSQDTTRQLLFGRLLYSRNRHQLRQGRCALYHKIFILQAFLSYFLMKI